eukprot:TRINITY_DN7761_c0_g1_i1.p1 TRINITY_DN7761_c0_g1~~TRINITY_DN7761_c0_g1_i1.p1  ORF type:complete len:376 (-),score=58.21 TRINITY_DN7761_c0_g1_i1:84-1211(-)
MEEPPAQDSGLATSVSNVFETFVEQIMDDENKCSFPAAKELSRGVLGNLYKDTEIDWLALRLLKGHCVFSRDWRSDLWLHMKNKQPFISILLAHPGHPFRRRERIMAVLLSCLLAWAMETWFCVFWTSCVDHPEMNFLTLLVQVLLFKIVVSAVVNGVYDAVMEQAFTCACVQTGHSNVVKNFCERLSFVQFFIQLTIAAVMFGFGLYWLLQDGEHSVHNILTATRELVVGKIVGLFVVTMLLELVGFYAGRRAQMKPTDEDAIHKWDQPSRGCFGLCPESEPPSYLWNRFIGKTKTFDDLPEHAPTYDVKVRCCCKVIYSERADDRTGIPKCCKRRSPVQEVRVHPEPPPTSQTAESLKPLASPIPPLQVEQLG